MIDDSERLIARQLRSFARADGIEPLYLVTPCVRMLAEDPFIRPILDDLHDQAEQDVSDFFEANCSAGRLVRRAGELLVNNPVARSDPKMQERMIALEALADPQSVTLAMDRSGGVWKEPSSEALDVLSKWVQELVDAGQRGADIMAIRRHLNEAETSVQPAAAVLNVQLRRPAFSFVRLLAATQYLPETQAAHARHSRSPKSDPAAG
jgi:hypothetical protein